MQASRTATGSLGACSICMAVLVILPIAAYCVSFARVGVARTELQNAVDAAATAGVQDLWTDPDRAKDTAVLVAKRNRADGQPVSSSSKGTTLAVTVIRSDGVFPGWVQVNARRAVTGALVGVPGVPTAIPVSVTALAGTSGSVTTVNRDQLFPLAVSLDAIPMERTIRELPLREHHLGDSIVLYTNGQQSKNVAFTSFFESASDFTHLRSILDQSLGGEQRVPNAVPKVRVGDAIKLDNSALGTNFLASGEHAAALLKRPLITMPVILGNPQFMSAAKVIGFVSLRVTGFTLTPSGHELDTIRGTLVKGMVHGLCERYPSSGDSRNDEALAEIAAGNIKLLPLNYLEVSPLARRHALVEFSQPQPTKVSGATVSTPDMRASVSASIKPSGSIAGRQADSARLVTSATAGAIITSHEKQPESAQSAALRMGLWLLWCLAIGIVLIVFAKSLVTRSRAVNRPASRPVIQLR